MGCLLFEIIDYLAKKEEKGFALSGMADKPIV